jgi:tRNA nucleotidyltransferase (CCA-adding enzyme)
MKTYVVGGWVRDRLLAEAAAAGGDAAPPAGNDRDWVVVGATPEDMQRAGYLPVGRDFPVFLHPQTHEEYALARTERKTAPGYHGFTFHAAPDVTLEQDLARRDLTINAMAIDPDAGDAAPGTLGGRLVDPYGGARDLAAKRLRHVGPAFAEDPVRILRVARFAARWPQFDVDPGTNELMRAMVAAGEADALVPERVWQELARALMEAQPSRFFDTLRACGALARLLPELDRLWGVPQSPESHPEIDTGIHVMMVLDTAARLGYSLPVRYAALLHDLGKGTTDPALWPKHRGHEERSVELALQVSERLRAPSDCRDLAIIVAREHGRLLQFDAMDAPERLDLLERCDALRRPERFDECLDALEADYRGRTGYADRALPVRAAWTGALAAVRAVDAGAIARNVRGAGRDGDIAAAVRAARVEALR